VTAGEADLSINEALDLGAFVLDREGLHRSTARKHVPAATVAVVRSLLVLRCSREQNALHTSTWTYGATETDRSKKAPLWRQFGFGFLHVIPRMAVGAFLSQRKAASWDGRRGRHSHPSSTQPVYEPFLPCGV
jgi:hypothetical protein